MFDFLGVTVVVVLTALFSWLALRAWRARRPVVKWAAFSLAGLLSLAGLAILAATLLGYAKLNRKYDNPVLSISVEITPERVARGERFGVFCAGCHAEDGTPPMEGSDFLGRDAPPIGTFYAPNLTPTHLGDWTDGEIIRAIREGVHKDGRSLLIMPSRMFRNLSDEDVQGIVAFLRSQPPVEPDTPRARLNMLGAIMANIAPIFEAQPPITEPIVAPPPGPTAEYGGYLASYTCTMCHGAELEGDEEFNAPGLIGAGLTWSDAEFISFMRTGVKPDGVEVDGQMPWKELSRLFSDDDELRAIFLHIYARFAPSASEN